MRKKLVGVVMTTVLSGFFMTSVFAAGWSQDEKGYYYQYDNGTYAKSGTKEIDGVTYMFDSQGYMVTGWQLDNSKWYYYDIADGVRATEWKQIDGKWYYFEPNNNGVMHVSWLNLGNKRYYFDENGVMQTGIFFPSISPYAYEADETGALIRNTTKEKDNRTIRYDEDGVMMYRNNTTRMADGAGGDVWQYVLNEDAISMQKEENNTLISERVYELKDAYYDAYVSKILKAKTSAKQKRLANWEKNVRHKLNLYLSEEEINSYILEVKSGSYRKYDDDSRYDYDDDYDDDYDYDYDDYDD